MQRDWIMPHPLVVQLRFTRSEFQRAEAAFERLRTPAGLPLTYDVIYLHACK